MTIEQLIAAVNSGQLVRLHTSVRSGYVSRKTAGEVRAYKGKFGEGFTFHFPSWDSTRHHFVTYYVRAA
jgi:hypothetical protein